MQTSVLTQDEVPSPAQLRQKPLPTVPTLLFRLILACLLPALIGAGILIYLEYEHGRKQQHENTVLSVRDKLDAVDAKLEQSELFARTLAISGVLNRQDLGRFQQRTQNLLRESNLKLSVILYDIDGQQLLNSNTPFGERLPKRQDLGQIQSVFATGKMIPATVISRTSDGHAMVGIMVPVFSGSKVVYALAVGFNPQKLNQLLAPQHLPPGAFAAIIDSKGIIAGRSHEAEKYIGQKAHPEFLKQIDAHSEGTFELATEKDMLIQATFKSSPQSGWTVGIAIPKQRIEMPLTHDLLMLSLGGALLLALSLLSASLVGKRIAKSLRALHTAAVALGAGTLTSLPVDVLHETHELSLALQNSANRLLRRTQQLEVANTSLQERSTELNEAQHIAQIGNWKWNFKSHHFFASDELLRQFGPDIMLAYQAQDETVFPADVLRQIEEASKETCRTGVSYSLDLNVFNKDGVKVWVNARGLTTLGETGKVNGLRGTVQDISQHKAAEAELRESKIRLETALSSSGLVLWEYFVERNELVFLERLATIQGFGWDENPTPVPNYLKTVFPPDVVLMYKDLENYLCGSSPKFETTFRALHKDGHYLWLHSTGKAVERDAEGKPVRLLGVTMDITERKHNETAMKALQKELDATLVWQVAQHTVAALAHEVNQPLASASILCEAAIRMLTNKSTSKDNNGDTTQRLSTTLQSITNDIERAGGVLKNLLSSVNKPDITRASVQVNVMVAESIQTVLEEGILGHQIIANYAPDLPTVHVNPLQVVKVLLNLIHNAAQAMHGAQMPDRKIWINTALTADGREICVTVKDEGPGISAALQKEIFQPFITTKSSGLGMGLTISVALIEAQGGKLWHTQEGGQGAAFHFTLPISV